MVASAGNLVVFHRIAAELREHAFLYPDLSVDGGCSFEIGVGPSI